MQNTLTNKNKALGLGFTHTNNHSDTWLKIADDTKDNFFANELVQVCHSKQQDKRWILCVDSDDKDLLQLSKQVDKNKLLRVNGQHKNVEFDKIQRALLRGNCSTVVLCDTKFSAQQLRSLQICAQRGNTQCIIVNKAKQQLH
ncbi:hypothetical protein AADZ86_12960 [Colwelliaceae bacterium BS250]